MEIVYIIQQAQFGRRCLARNLDYERCLSQEKAKEHPSTLTHHSIEKRKSFDSMYNLLPRMLAMLMKIAKYPIQAILILYIKSDCSRIDREHS